MADRPPGDIHVGQGGAGTEGGRAGGSAAGGNAPKGGGIWYSLLLLGPRPHDVSELAEICTGKREEWAWIMLRD